MNRAFDGRPLRLAMVSEHASPLALLGGVDSGGQNVHVADLARALGRLGVEVVVHTRRDDPALQRRVPFAKGVVVDHVDAGPAVPLPKDDLLPHMPAFARDLTAAWALDRPDVVHSHFWMSGLAALEPTRRLGIPLAHTYHALGVVKRRHQGANDTSPDGRLAIEARLAREVEHVVATTAEEAFELLGMGGCMDRISIVPCGVDLAHFTATGPREARGRRARLVVVSRLVERKGIGNVITALPRLPDVELVVAGAIEGAAEAAEAQRLRDMATRLGVGDRVELRGAVERAALPDLLRSADVVACCPWYEPFGLVAVEAMACGVPVVASAVGGLAESVVDGQTGIQVPPRRPDRIAEAVQVLLGDRRLRRNLGRAGARRAKRYSWDRIARETLRVAEDLARTPQAVETEAMAPLSTASALREAQR